MKQPANSDIAALLNHIADLLEAEGENPFRIRSYRSAAATVAGVRQSLAALVVARGAEGLSGLKGIGPKLGGLIEDYVTSGKVELVQDLEKKVPADKLKAIETKSSKHEFAKPIPIPIELILDMDEEYRKLAALKKLKMVAPRLLNPEKKAWLPVMTKVSMGYKFTIMFSNTATAHTLGKTTDWVVVYYEKGKGENQCTVVTESRGKLKGKRVIRGRERECAEYYG
jgi:hypothetical protein